MPNPTRAVAAGRDSLTAALPRASFVATLEREAANANAGGRPFSVCLVDVDDLRQINARFGYREGDRVLRAVAEAAREELRRPRYRDVPSALGRYDGDELAVVLRHADSDDVREFAGAVTAAVAAARVCKTSRVKLSAAAVVYEFGESVDALLARLESTLHVCKQFGDGGVEVAPAGSWERAARTLKVGEGPRPAS
jgi:diguanylate cyclase (GGDEF)-like protein